MSVAQEQKKSSQVAVTVVRKEEPEEKAIKESIQVGGHILGLGSDFHVEFLGFFLLFCF